MRRALLPLLALLAGCGQAVESEDAIRARAQLIRQCPGGMLVGRDPVTKRLTWSTGWAGGVIDPDVRIQDVCVVEKGK